MPHLASTDFCNGCEVCANICPKSCISFEMNEFGFYYPHIDTNMCIECKLCEKSCPILSPKFNYINIKYNDTLAFAAHHKNKKTVLKSSSGGVFTAICELFIENKGHIYGVIYDKDFREVKFSSAHNLEDTKCMRGSKYVLARKNYIYREVKKDLNNNIDCCFFGLPCEIGGLHTYLGKEYKNLTTVELICAGTGSYKVHNDFINKLEDKYKAKCTFFTYRAKKNGWVPYYIKVKFNNGKIFSQKYTQSDAGIGIGILKRPSCYNCHYKGQHRTADITIGDFWTLSSKEKCYNHWGTSVVFVRTDKGEKLISQLPTLEIVKVNSQDAVKSNKQQLLYNCIKGEDYEIFKNLLIKEGLEEASKKFKPKENFKDILKNIIPGNIYYLIKKIGQKFFQQ